MTETLLTHDSSPPGDGQVPPARRKPWLGKMLLRLHFYAGVLVGPFILLSALSGALYALAPTIERAVYQHELTAPVTDQTLSLADQIRLAQDQVDGLAVSAVRPAPEPGATTRVMFADPSLGGSESRAVFVDPGTGEIRGDLTVYGTSGALPLRTWISNLHRSLHLGDTGRFYSELAASWLGVVAAAGLALWIIRRRTSRSRRDFVVPSTRHKGYRRYFSWHASLGIWVVLGAVFLSATGVTWSQFAGNNIGNLRAALDWGTPSVTTSLDGTQASAGEGHDHGSHGGHDEDRVDPGTANPATFDAVLAIGQRTNIETGLVEIVPPAADGTAWVVREIKGSFPTGANVVAIDGTTLEVVDSLDFADFSLPAKLTRWGIDLHSGFLFGFVNQVVLFLLATGIATMVVLGYLMWWKRRPTREPRPLMGTPPARGALRGAPWWGIALVAAAGIAVGLWLPLVGWTLVGFLVLDTVIGVIKSTRSRTATRV